jgi:hypothetical protein
MHTLLPTTSPEVASPTARRRAAVDVAGLLACVVPVVFTASLGRMLLLGELDEHRFHQLTGQGLLLTLLWLAVPRRPDTRILMMTMSTDDDAVVAAMRPGARG